MIFEHYILMYSLTINSIVLISYIVARRKDEACKYLFESKESIGFNGKTKGIHVKHLFFKREDNSNPIHITITDKNDLSVLNGAKSTDYKGSDMHKYKYAKKLLDYLVGNLNKWEL